MSNKIELVSDGEGVAVFGDPSEVELFLSNAGVPSKEFALRPQLSSALNAGSSVAQAGSQIATNSGRWVKLTEESAKALKLGKTMKGSTEGVSRAIITTSKGRTTKILEFVKPDTIGPMLTNPAMLAGAAGIMAQMAMQQTMEEITEYLKIIDEKVDDVLRAQKDATLSEMIGVGLVIDDAMLKREHVGHVSEVTWSSLHGAAQTIANTQSYALLRFDALAEKLEKKHKVGDLAKLTANAEKDVEDWLAVLARCFQLQDGLDVLELDRVLDSSPEDLYHHRDAIRAARARRRDLIVITTQRLQKRVDAAADVANTQVLAHPRKAKAVVISGNKVGADVAIFNKQLDIRHEWTTQEAKRWVEAVDDAGEKVVHVIQASASAIDRFSSEVVENAKEAGKGITSRVTEWLPQSRKAAPKDNEDGHQQKEC